MKRSFALLASLLLAVLLVHGGSAVHAAPPEECLNIDGPTAADVVQRLGCTAGFHSPGEFPTGQQDELIIKFGAAVSIVLGFTGLIFVVLMLYSGFLWMTARGNEDQVTSAQQNVRNAVIGIILVFTAFIVARTVINFIAFSGAAS